MCELDVDGEFVLYLGIVCEVYGGIESNIFVENYDF